ncbi:MAG: hypothetical protein U0787_01910 [Polyangia bacterium]
MSRRAFDPLGFSASVFALASLLSCNPAPATSDDGPADLSTIPPTSPPDFASVAGDSVPAGAVAFFSAKTARKAGKARRRIGSHPGAHRRS